MQLIYSTNELARARRLAALLDREGIANSLSNTGAAGLPGFPARWTPGFVGVWLSREDDASAAHRLMGQHGYLAPAHDVDRSGRPEVVLWMLVGLSVVGAVVAAVVIGSRGG